MQPAYIPANDVTVPIATGPTESSLESPGAAVRGGTAERIPASPAAARRQALRGLIAERGFVSVSGISREIGISEMTIRRDLEALEQAGLIERAHGGAIPRAPAPAEPSFAARRGRNAAAKAAIAAAALPLIHPGDVLGLDVGSSVACLAALLRGRSDVSIVTNSLQSVLALSGTDLALPDIYVLGGRLRPQEGSLCGRIALQQIAGHWLDRAFLGAAGLDAEGLYDYSPEEAEVKAAFIARARERILLCDSSKFGQRSFLRLCGLDAITMLITDADPPAPVMRELKARGAQVVVAPVS